MIDFILKWLNVAVFKSYQTSKKQTPSGQVRKGQVSLDQTVKESCQNLSELREKNIFEPEIIQLIKTKIFKVLIEIKLEATATSLKVRFWIGPGSGDFLGGKLCLR